MNQSQPKNLIYGKLFLISVALLLLNDFYLKYHFHNYLTGKLSDFVGLFAFPYFVSLFFKGKVKPIYILTGILFIFWKSSSSQFVIDNLNSVGIGINRVVDYSDLIALFILPLSYQYRIKISTEIKQINFLPKSIIIGTCSFSFIATTLPGEIGELNLKSNYEREFEIKKDSLFIEMFKIETFQFKKSNKYITNLKIPDRKTSIQISMLVTETGKDKIKIKLDSIKTYFISSSSLIFGIDNKDLNYIKNLKLKDFEELFIEQKIEKFNQK
ncbi:hypothetical protein L3X37_15185 [Sabulilitoribacter arenilitoris]|uniref:Uncharacterized protein n=1 Tax=Wocania arenilitoris TaxID=2044858 RepID=A0AAE3EQB1_9FLAO|nr:hypothetical protein [Wocania arenilitoris]MCF7569690.1 hypothetical protein [Wocania arenilitoris]